LESVEWCRAVELLGAARVARSRPVAPRQLVASLALAAFPAPAEARRAAPAKAACLAAAAWEAGVSPAPVARRLAAPASRMRRLNGTGWLERVDLLWPTPSLAPPELDRALVVARPVLVLAARVLAQAVVGSVAAAVQARAARAEAARAARQRVARGAQEVARRRRRSAQPHLLATPRARRKASRATTTAVRLRDGRSPRAATELGWSRPARAPP
jgi:hypothetical protein